jgi:hypothetical protein
VGVAVLMAIRCQDPGGAGARSPGCGTVAGQTQLHPRARLLVDLGLSERPGLPPGVDQHELAAFLDQLHLATSTMARFEREVRATLT